MKIFSGRVKKDSLDEFRKCYFDRRNIRKPINLRCSLFIFYKHRFNDKVLETKTYSVRPRRSRIYQVDALMINKFDPFELKITSTRLSHLQENLIRNLSKLEIKDLTLQPGLVTAMITWQYLITFSQIYLPGLGYFRLETQDN